MRTHLAVLAFVVAACDRGPNPWGEVHEAGMLAHNLALNLSREMKGGGRDVAAHVQRSGEESRDFWGRHYRVRVDERRRLVIVVSAGKDAMFGTSDDVHSEMGW